MKYQLIGTIVGSAKIIGYTVLNKYKRYAFHCRCGCAFERNANKIVRGGEFLRQEFCPKCRCNSARMVLAQVYRQSYAYKAWRQFIDAAFAKKGLGQKRRIEIPEKYLDFFEFFKDFGDKHHLGMFLKLKFGSSILSVRNAVWVPADQLHLYSNI